MGKKTLEQLAKEVDLSADNVKEFLKRFPIKPEEIDWEPLEVAKGKEVVLANRGRTAKQIVNLQPRSVEDVRRWVGAPIIATEKASSELHLTSKEFEDAHLIPATATLDQLNADAGALLTEAATKLIYGSVHPKLRSAPLYLAAEKLVVGFKIPVWLGTIINVNPGATLTIDPTVAVVSAFRIRLWRGGTIRVTGNVAFRCQQFHSDVT